MEGRVFVCEWKKTGAKFTATVKRLPKITASASKFAQLDELLWERIMDHTGDGENTREYIPPPPIHKALVSLRPLRLVSVAGNTHSTPACDAAGLFTGGMCPRCKSLLGARNEQPLVLEYVAPGYDAGFVWQKPFNFFSEDFLKLLTKKERAQFDWRKVEILRRNRKTFYEMLPRNYVPPVAVKGLKFEPLRCGKCKSVLCLHHFSNDTAIYQYLCETDLPSPRPPALAFGTPHNFRLCLESARWMKLVGRPGTAGITTNRLGVIPETLRDPKPKMKPYSNR